MKKISILSLHLGYGGIEECVVNLANSLVDKYNVEILCTYKLYDVIPHKLDSRVKVVYLTQNIKPNKEEFKDALSKKRIFKIISEGIKAIKVLIIKKKVNIDAIKNSDADIIISTRDYFNYLVGKYANNKYKIGWEHSHHNNDSKYIKNITKSCKNLDRFVLVSESLKNYYETIFKNEYINCKCVFISNYLDNIPVDKSNLSNNNLISVGRLENVKGYTDLIDVINIVNKDYKVKLDIIGDGSLKGLLQDKINSLNLSDCITLHGFKDKDFIDNMYMESSLYVMTSLSESFGLVLIEAMSYGLPCIAFDSAQGACDLIKNDYNGYLIPNRDKEMMASYIINLLSNKDKMNLLGKNASEFSLKFEKSKIINEWISLLEDNK